MTPNRSLLVLIAFFGATAPAFAYLDCDGPDDDTGGREAAARPGKVPDAMATSCSRAGIGRQLLINNSEVLSRVVAGSFGIGPAFMEPAGLGNMSAAEAAARLTGDSSFLISPTADAVAVAVAPSRKWNSWIDGKYTWNDNSPANFDLDGPLWNGLAGFDYKLTDKITVGLMGSFESTNLKGTGVDTASEGWGGGPYLGIVLNDHLVFSANVIGTSIDSSQSGVFYYDSERLQTSAALNGYWYKDTWRFTPGLSASWSKEWLKETAGLSSDQTVEVGLLTQSVQLGDTLRLSEKATVEPWAGAALDWTFLSKFHQQGFPTTDAPNVDLRLQGGLNFAFGSNVQLALTGEAGGLLLSTVDTYSGEVNLAIQF